MSYYKSSFYSGEIEKRRCGTASGVPEKLGQTEWELNL